MSNRIRSLDGLRGISILLVLISHAGLGDIVPGGLGVTIFFFISGYIITLLLLKELRTTGTIDIRAFYIRRAFRILPTLAIYLGACTLFLIVNRDSGFLKPLIAAILNIYNYYFIFFATHDGAFWDVHPYSIVWSLCIEEHYYLIFPLLLLVLWRRPRALIFILIGATVVALFWRYHLLSDPDLLPNRIYKATDTRIDSIIFGALLAIVQAQFPALYDQMSSRVLGAILGLSGLLVSLAIRDPHFRESLRYTLQSASLFLGFAYAISGFNSVSKTLSNPVIIFFGRISYSLYLWHWLVHVWLGHTFGKGSNLAYVLMPPIAVGVAYLSYRYIETPFLELLHRKSIATINSAPQSQP